MATCPQTSASAGSRGDEIIILYMPLWQVDRLVKVKSEKLDVQ